MFYFLAENNLQPRNFFGNGCLCVINLLHSFVEGGSFLDGNKALESHFLTNLFDSGDPLAKSVFLHQGPASRCHFLRHDSAAIRFHQVLFRQTANGFGAGAVPHLPFASDDADAFGLFLADDLAARNTASGGTAFGGTTGGPFGGTATDGHDVDKLEWK